MGQPVQKIQSMENYIGTFTDKQQSGWTGHVIKKIRKTGSISKRHESGRMKHADTEENMTSATLDEPVSLTTQKDQKQTHRLTCQIFK